MEGVNEWVNVDVVKVGARGNGDEFFGTGGGGFDPTGGGGFDPTGGGGFDPTGGGGFDPTGGGGFDPTGGGGFDPTGGTEQDVETACSAADPVPSAPSASMSGKSVVLNWTPPGGPCQVRRYDVWRAQGSFPTLKSVLANFALFSNIGHNVPPPTPPSTTFPDNSKLQNNTIYTYFVTDTDAQGATSRASDPVTVLVTFSTK